MFGTVARSRLKDGVTVEQLKAQFADPDDRPASAVALLIFQSASDPREIWIASVFESRDAYTANAESADQQARFERMRALMEGQPEWHDGEVLFALAENRALSRS